MILKNELIESQKSFLKNSYKYKSVKLISKTNRNQIYQINDNKILKFYSKPLRWEQEILALKNVKFSELEIPRLLDYGTDKSNLFWIEQTAVPGNAVSNLINIFEHPELIRQIGTYQALFHNENIIEKSDIWDKMQLEGTYSLSHKRIIELNKTRLKKLYDSDYFPHSLIKKIKITLGMYENCILETTNLVICHNDFSHRNLLATSNNNSIIIKSLIDFELCFPADNISDLCRFLQDLLSNECDVLVKEYLTGYNSINKLKKSYPEKMYYYILSLCIEVMTWSFKNAPDYYESVYKTLNSLIDKRNYYIDIIRI
ncbi:MAG: aminoglycoside phosphotransferase family protein [bacterium]|nr:aminoglycoside phosphotransferase family protein [bacterium]